MEKEDNDDMLVRTKSKTQKKPQPETITTKKNPHDSSWAVPVYPRKQQ